MVRARVRCDGEEDGREDNSMPKSYPEPASQISSHHCTVLAHPRQEHCHATIQAFKQIPPRDKAGEDGSS